MKKEVPLVMKPKTKIIVTKRVKIPGYLKERVEFRNLEKKTKKRRKKHKGLVHRGEPFLIKNIVRASVASRELY